MANQNQSDTPLEADPANQGIVTPAMSNMDRAIAMRDIGNKQARTRKALAEAKRVRVEIPATSLLAQRYPGQLIPVRINGVVTLLQHGVNEAPEPVARLVEQVLAGEKAAAAKRKRLQNVDLGVIGQAAQDEY